MQTCKTCLFWGIDFKNTCGREGTIKPDKNDDGFEIEASADDDSNLQTKLITGPDFGCVHHWDGKDKET